LTTSELMLTCRECGREFEFTEEDQKAAIASGSPGRPSRCPECKSGQPRSFESPIFEDTLAQPASPERRQSRRPREENPTEPRPTNVRPERPASPPSSAREPRRRLFEIICAECGTLTQVKFQPREDRPVYCDVCFADRKTTAGTPQRPADRPQRAPQSAPARNAPAPAPNSEFTQDEIELPDTANVFESLDVGPATRAALAAMGITTPTPIQQGTIPVLMSGQDVVGQARTGSGKTLAFAIPMVERIDPSVKEVQGLVLVPTRELAIQVDKVIQGLAASRRIKVALLYGGRSLRGEQETLRRGAHIVVGTPGRTLDHLRQKNLSILSIKMAILDEADEMLDRGFAPDVERILSHTPPERQTALFSATMPEWVRKTASRQLRDAEMIEVDSGLQAPPEIDHLIYDIDGREKFDALMTLLDRRGDGAVLVFGRTKHGVRKLAQTLHDRGYEVDALQGNMSQPARERVVELFRARKIPILVATNVAARGLDIDGIDQVINYDLPDSGLLFTHRVGRTGRMGRQGEAITFVTPEEASKWREIWRGSGGKLTTQPWPNARRPVIPSSVSDDLPRSRNGGEGKRAWHFAPAGSRRGRF
jgi:CxxC-x17-CxxC domain-containing protein